MGATGKFHGLDKTLDTNVTKTSGDGPIPGLDKAMETMPEAYERFMAREHDLVERGVKRPCSPGIPLKPT